MCRNIRTLHNFDPPATEDEIQASALQYVRKISGFSKPSQANAEAFERAVEDVAAISARLLDELVTNAPPKDREVEEGHANGAGGARCVGDHARGVALQGAVVWQAGEGVRRRAHLRNCEVARVGEHRRGLDNRVPDPIPMRLREGVHVLDEHRPDHLAAHEQRLAGGALSAPLAAELAFHEGRVPGLLLVDPAEPDRKA